MFRFEAGTYGGDALVEVFVALRHQLIKNREYMKMNDVWIVIDREEQVLNYVYSFHRSALIVRSAYMFPETAANPVILEITIWQKV